MPSAAERETRLSEFIDDLLRLVLRIVLLAMALVFIASLVVAGALLLAVWAVRRLWARLIGRPVSPWVFRIDPRAQWNRFYHAADDWPPGSVRREELRRGQQQAQDVEVKERKHTDDDG
ncbi:MAG: hypothetical protein JSR49_14540 [Proteobacteria bacterium]|nr:hypothetical protein [Pseudomonadota bacterium]